MARGSLASARGWKDLVATFACQRATEHIKNKLHFVKFDSGFGIFGFRQDCGRSKLRSDALLTAFRSSGFMEHHIDPLASSAAAYLA